jgi:membrane-bound serine protease (ClpP class)
VESFGLKDTIDSKVNDVASLNILVGAEGLTVSALRPSGTIVIDNQKVEAQSNGELIDAGTKVIVLESLPNKVIVKTKVTPL